MNEGKFNPEINPPARPFEEPAVEPAPAESPEDSLNKITSEKVLNTWHNLSLVERKFIVTTDSQFEELIYQIQPEKAVLFRALRGLINSHHELASGILKELDEAEPATDDLEEVLKNLEAAGLIKKSKENESGVSPELAQYDFKKLELGGQSIICLELADDDYSWYAGLVVARTHCKQNVNVRYPNPTEALKILNKFKKEYPDKPLAIYIDEENSFLFMSKSGTETGIKTDGDVPKENKLFIIVLPQQAQGAMQKAA